ncbi:MAG: hypothetical protein KBB91_00725 [Candidatus Pacebacteria bacterium]|nr:hypothetical protein [Candidatus Paceibacterota bacterium]MBP9700930.1 hypothetical protein [Candidatus Paceibacterota bacterium]
MKTSQHGYSVLELLIYIALFAFLSVVLIQSLVTVMKTYTQAQSYRALQTNGEFVMERITRELRNGTTATTSACATTPGTLSIASTDSGGTSHTNVFMVADAKAQLVTDGAGAVDLSTTEVSVTSLTFCSLTTPVGQGVKTTLVLSTTKGIPISASFYSTIVLRGQ